MSVETIPAACELSDRELLRRYIDSRERAAIAALIRRHAGVVSGVCRRILGAGANADDAFQATFLVLVKSSHRVHQPDSLAGFLYGVASRISRRMRRKRSVQPVLPLKDRPMNDGDPWEIVASRNDLAVLDEELAKLAERTRSAILLHHLEGLVVADVAREMQTSPEAVHGLLKRGRRELQARLRRRGVTLGAALAALGTVHEPVTAAEVDSLVESAIEVLQYDASLTGASAECPVANPHPVAFQLARQEIVAMSLLNTGKLVGVLALAALVTLPAVGQNSGQPGSEAPVSSVIAADTESSQIAADVETSVGSGDQDSGFGSRDPEQGRAEDPAMEELKAEHAKRLHDVSPMVRRAEFAGGAVLSRRSNLEHRYEQELDEPTDFEFSGQTLTDVMQFISDLHDLQIKIDRVALEDEGIAVDTPVDLQGFKGTLRSGMDLILEPLGLDYVIQNDVILVTTKSKAENIFDLRVYNVGQLPFDSEALVMMVMDLNVKGGGQWQAEDGAGGTITGIPGGLVVQNTWRTHRAVTELLELLTEQAALSSGQSSGTAASSTTATGVFRPKSEQSGGGFY